MKAFLFSLLALIVLGLCAVCAVQWQREFLLNSQIDALVERLDAENKLRAEAETRALRFEEEITRLTTLRAEVESALLDSVEKSLALTEDQTGRGHSIRVWMNEAATASQALAASQARAGQGAAAIQDRNTEVQAQNAAIEKANASLRQLATERDAAISQLNARVREYNELVEKYNKLSRNR